MCTICGCGTDEVKVDGHAHAHGHEHAHGKVNEHAHPHENGHGHDDHHDHGHDHALHSHDHMLAPSRAVTIERDILARNDAEAAVNRRRFAEHGIFALNLVSSPGSGKTTLLVETISHLQGEPAIAVIEGDQQTSNDAELIRATGARAVQINTGKGCHLDAHMVGHALEHLEPADDSVVMIENVGNLVCPAAFDLGEAHKVVMLSVTEGEDKPLKYPDMFAAADLMILTKCDLLPYLKFDADLCEANARRVNPSIEVMRLSATTGVGIAAWIDWVRDGARAVREAKAATVESLRNRVAELEAQLATRG